MEIFERRKKKQNKKMNKTNKRFNLTLFNV